LTAEGRLCSRSQFVRENVLWKLFFVTVNGGGSEGVGAEEEEEDDATDILQAFWTLWLFNRNRPRDYLE
jgi:hypothetical protein